MCAASKKITFVFCIFSLITPYLYAQNDAIPLAIIPFPEKEQLNKSIIFNILLFLEKDAIKNIAPSELLPSSKKNATRDINNTKLSFPAYLIPTRQSITFMSSYGTSNEAFFDFIDKKIHEGNFREKEEKRVIREQWKQLFGLDIWYPYFKAKEIEDWISASTTVELLNFKGRMKFENNQIKYTFKTQF